MAIALTQCLLLGMLLGPVDDPNADEGIKVTVILRGADSDADLEVLTKALRSTKGVKLITESVGVGFRKFNNRFTTPIVVSVPKSPGTDDANVGALATVVSKAKTSNRDKFPPGVNLILFTDGTLNESSIMDLRSSLSRLNGVEVDQPGGLGARIQEGWCWIQFENAGGAMLKEIEERAQASGLKYRRLKDAPDE
ncbi:MAG: hypothetical protein H8E66_22635 [Planctomycetes bacterium]|nr:hypothetical protein [Planctomycetota bacterium]